MQLKRFVVLFGVILAVVGLAVLSVHAQSYSKIHFVAKSLTVNPPRTGEGMRVTFNFTVENEGGPIKHVIIRVLHQCNSRGEGKLLTEVPGQTIKRGTNMYAVSGIFQPPAGDKSYLLIQLLDHDKNEKAPPVIATSGVRQWLPVTFRLAPPVS